VSADLNRVVTTITSDGKSVFADESTVEPSPAMGLAIYNLWGTADGIPKVGAGIEPSPVAFPFFPGPGGHRVIMLEFPPAAAGSHDDADPEAAKRAEAEAERNQPGLLGVFDPDDPGFHTTDSIDYGFCLEGEVWLTLDDGQERRITPGTLVVQRGTRHAWQNRGDRPCRMLVALLGAERA
jgi:uncharacterized cupin superfamily protein